MRYCNLNDNLKIPKILLWENYNPFTFIDKSLISKKNEENKYKYKNNNNDYLLFLFIINTFLYILLFFWRKIKCDVYKKYGNRIYF